jgi:fused signal recognition particle receptor
MGKRFWQHPGVQKAAIWLLRAYLAFALKTTRWRLVGEASTTTILAGAPVIAGSANADAAGLAFDALTRAQREGSDVLLIDTAGRLHNKSALMEELRKIIRVLRKQDETAPHAVVLVLDATTGQNAIEQVRVFKEMVDVSGLIVTKLDGSARGGVVVALAENFGLPVFAVGVGEQAGDLRPFDAQAFAAGLVGL